MRGGSILSCCSECARVFSNDKRSVPVPVIIVTHGQYALLATFVQGDGFIGIVSV